MAPFLDPHTATADLLSDLFPPTLRRSERSEGGRFGRFSEMGAAELSVLAESFVPEDLLDRITCRIDLR